MTDVKQSIESPQVVSALNLFEFEALAREKLATGAYDYYAGGAGDEITLDWNQSAFRELALLPRMLVDVSKRSLETTLLGEKISMPVVVAPMAFQGMAHRDGERATAQATGASATIMTLSTLSNNSIEEVAAAATGSLWFQLYVYKDRGVSVSLVERAQAAGFKALVLTVDSPVLGRRQRDVKNRFQLPDAMRMGNFSNGEMERFPQDGSDSGLFAYIAALYDTSLTWKDLEWFASISSLPVLVKGIMRPDDAERALSCGASGIIVSNHGGRQLDTTLPTIKALPAVVQAVGDKAPVLVDGGIRRGTDVLKALALGARAVLLGRPVLWGLTLAGREGVSCVLEMLRSELDLAMALSGCVDLAGITPDLLSHQSIE